MTLAHEVGQVLDEGILSEVQGLLEVIGETLGGQDFLHVTKIVNIWQLRVHTVIMKIEPVEVVVLEYERDSLSEIATPTMDLGVILHEVENVII